MAAAVAAGPSCKLVGIPFRMASAVVARSNLAIDEAAERHRLKKEARQARETARDKEAAAAAKTPTAPVTAPPPAAAPDATGQPALLPPVDELAPLPKAGD